jgi:hypothetical protein
LNWGPLEEQAVLLTSEPSLQPWYILLIPARTWEAEAGGSLCSRPVRSTEQTPGQPEQHRETLSQREGEGERKRGRRGKERKNVESQLIFNNHSQP